MSNRSLIVIIVKIITRLGLATALLPALILWSAWTALPAYAQDPDLVTDTSVVTVTYNGAYQDYTIPETGAPDTITLLVKAGDGGDAYISYGSACGVSSCSGDGGKGAELSATFEIGTGAGQLQPGGTLRFIVGETGASKSLDAWACGGNRDGGGGGGSAVVYKAPGDSWSLNDTVMLVVAGAGGGGSAGSVWFGSCTQDTDGDDGLPNSTSGGDGSGGSGHHGGDNGCGGGYTRSSDDTTTSCSDVDDASIYVVDAGGWYGAGMSSGTTCGAEPGQSGVCSNYDITPSGTFEGGDGGAGDSNAGAGGYGFGGGGSGISEWPIAGGGGGYSGGGGGGLMKIGS